MFVACNCMWERNVVNWDLVGNSGVRTALWRRRRKWDNNIKMDLQEVVCGVMVWTELAVCSTIGWHL